jgi:pimeloyl-ACP methyl ester carboxylesterase
MRWFSATCISAIGSGLLAFGAFAQDEPEPSGWSAWLDAARDLQQQAKQAVDDALGHARPLPRHDGIALLSTDPAAAPGGPLVCTPLTNAPTVPDRIVLLVHGMDEPGSIWDDLSPMLVAQGQHQGYGAATFTYPNDQALGDSAALLAAQLRDLRARGVTRVDLVAHSMGGLISRDALTRPDVYNGQARGHTDLPDVERLIMLGTPLAGSPWARLRAVAEIREQIERWADSDGKNPRVLLGFMSDGVGQAGADLLPGSAYLTDLDTRPWPSGVRITVVVGTVTPQDGLDLTWAKRSTVLRKVLGDRDTDRLVAGIDDLTQSLGDGVVSVESATPESLPEPADIVRVEASHRGMLTRLGIEQGVRVLVGEPRHETPPAIPIVLDRLDQPALPDQ